VNEDDKQSVLRLFPYGLHALTVRAGDDQHAIAAAWAMQASFAPPMIVVSAERESRCLPMIREAKAFALNILGTEQRELASRLGRGGATAPKLSGVPTKPAPVTGTPVIIPCLGWLDCRLVATMPAGDHTLVLGEVVEAGVEREGLPLTLAETGMRYSG
jgi:flavin reductase (DIM6/NTAB) family NADH-FMN oxidoreductase RutF